MLSGAEYEKSFINPGPVLVCILASPGLTITFHVPVPRMSHGSHLAYIECHICHTRVTEDAAWVIPGLQRMLHGHTWVTVDHRGLKFCF